ncbi:translation elongation factor Ts [bacterium]|nr:translation elongation factor Ts [bacterium]
MPAITADQVKALRDKTGAGMMECKTALAKTEGDIQAAMRILREAGAASAARKSARAAREGRIGSFVDPGRLGVLVEVNCETDFVAKTEAFLEFCDEAARTLAKNPSADLEASRTALVSKTGENIKISRHTRLESNGRSAVAAYIHMGSKIGVLAELSCQTPASLASPDLRSLLDEICMQIAASAPQVLTREEVPAERLAEERAILEKQVDAKKPAPIREKIIAGKLGSFYEQICLLEQPYIREPKRRIKDLLQEKGAALKDTLRIERFVRYVVGD